VGSDEQAKDFSEIHEMSDLSRMMAGLIKLMGRQRLSPNSNGKKIDWK
jgi:hypothetical protein